MKISLAMSGIPPKKDGANSMWRKRTDVPRLKALRLAAYEAMNGRPPSSLPVNLSLRVYAEPADGDLDNFITGVCDGLMAVHPRTPIDASLWIDLPRAARPDSAIAFRNDSCVTKIDAERLPLGGGRARYEIELEWA